MEQQNHNVLESIEDENVPVEVDTNIRDFSLLFFVFDDRIESGILQTSPGPSPFLDTIDKTRLTRNSTGHDCTH